MILVNLSILSQLFSQNFCKLSYVVCRILVISFNFKSLVCSFHLIKELMLKIILECYNREDPLTQLMALRLGCADSWNYLMY